MTKIRHRINVIFDKLFVSNQVEKFYLPVRHFNTDFFKVTERNILN